MVPYLVKEHGNKVKESFAPDALGRTQYLDYNEDSMLLGRGTTSVFKSRWRNLFFAPECTQKGEDKE